jgi:hypothetical protein
MPQRPLARQHSTPLPLLRMWCRLQGGLKAKLRRPPERQQAGKSQTSAASLTRHTTIQSVLLHSPHHHIQSVLLHSPHHHTISAASLTRHTTVQSVLLHSPHHHTISAASLATPPYNQCCFTVFTHSPHHRTISAASLATPPYNQCCFTHSPHHRTISAASLATPPYKQCCFTRHTTVQSVLLHCSPLTQHHLPLSYSPAATPSWWAGLPWKLVQRLRWPPKSTVAVETISSTLQPMQPPGIITRY